MSTSRLFVEAGLAAGIEAPLDEAQAHYLRHVMRRPDGAALSLFNGRDGEWAATLSVRGKKAAVALVGAQLRAQAAEPDLWLCFAPVKRARIDYIAEKATELGVSVLQPIRTQHTIVERVNVERLRANAVEAAEQTERLSVPEVREPVDLAQLLGGVAGRPAPADVRRDGQRPADRRGAVRARRHCPRGALGDRRRARGRLRGGRTGAAASH